MPSIGLVLGAGGVVGMAYHSGVLAALDDAGWDARTADVIVGTSAGSSIGATVRAGLSPADHFARANGGRLSPGGRRLVGPLAPVTDIPSRPALRAIPRPAAPWLLTSLVGLPGRARPGAALAGLLPAGTVPLTMLGDRMRSLYGSERWPDKALWICALRLRDGRRVVFGRDAVPVPDIGAAVEASSAIPGFFKPVRIGADDFVDGGAHSPTNADLVAGLGFDLVVVVSPMSAIRSALRPSWGAASRALAGVTLAREIRTIRGSGVPVLTIQPTVDDLRVMGPNPMDPARRSEVADQARRSVAARLEHPGAGDLVALLAG